MHLFQRADMVEAGWNVVIRAGRLESAAPRKFPNTPLAPGSQRVDELMQRDERSGGQSNDSGRRHWSDAVPGWPLFKTEGKQAGTGGRENLQKPGPQWPAGDHQRVREGRGIPVTVPVLV